MCHQSKVAKSRKSARDHRKFYTFSGISQDLRKFLIKFSGILQVYEPKKKKKILFAKFQMFSKNFHFTTTWSKTFQKLG